METSPWRHRKSCSSSAKMDSAAADNFHGYSSRRIKGKAHMVHPGSRAKPERARKSLNEKLATVVLESQAKDRRMSVSSRKGAEEIILLNDEVLDDEIGPNGDFSPSNDASDELLQRIESLLRDHGRTVRESEDDRTTERKHLEDDVMEMKRRLEGLAGENLKLRNSLVVKEKLVETLQDRKSRVESEFEALMGRLDSIEKENAFLRYEYHALEKDLEVRTEEMEYARRSIDLAHKQQLKSVNKIVELEAECQRLRLLIRKKIPSATILLQPKYRSTEAEERKMETRRSENLRNDFSMKDEFHNRKLHHDLVMEQLANIRDLSRGQKHKPVVDLAKRNRSPTFHDLSPVAGFDIGSEDRVSPSGSLSKDLVSEPGSERFKNLRRQRLTRASEMSLFMEDFAEMEKFAIVSTDKNPRDDEDNRPFDWLQVVLSAISKQQRISKRSVRELLEDIKIALGCMDGTKDTKKAEAEAESPALFIAWKSPNMSPESGSMTKEEIKRHLALGTTNLTFNDESLDRRKVSAGSEFGIQDLQEENKNLKDEIKKIDCESKELRLKLKEFEEKIRRLEMEAKTLKESRDSLEEEIESEKSSNQEVETELGLTRARLNETQQKLSSLEVELEFRKSCCEELEGTCLELQLQLQSMEKKEQPMYPSAKNRKQSHNGGWDATAAASIKLAECQETILHLRKQLKALSSETCHVSKFSKQGSSLRDQMLLENVAKIPENNNSCRPHDDDDGNATSALVLYTPRVYSIGKDEEEKRDGFRTMAIVQSHKKQSFGFIKKVLFRRRRGPNKKCLALTM